MKIELISVYDRGVFDKERIHFRALSDIDLNYYVIFDSAMLEQDKITIGERNSFWLSSKKIKLGENIVIYTKSGSESTENKDGATYHFLFRGLSKPLYSDASARPVVLELATWDTFKKFAQS